MRGAGTKQTVAALLVAAAFLETGCATRCWYEPDGTLADTSETHFERDMAECKGEAIRVQAAGGNTIDSLRLGGQAREQCMMAKGYRIQQCPR